MLSNERPDIRPQYSEAFTALSERVFVTEFYSVPNLGYHTAGTIEQLRLLAGYDSCVNHELRLDLR